MSDAYANLHDFSNGKWKPGRVNIPQAPGSRQNVGGRRLKFSATPVYDAYPNYPYGPWTLTVFNGTPPYSFTLNGNFPAGIVIDPVTGVVSGSPTFTPSVITFYMALAIAVTDSKGKFGTYGSFSIRLNPHTPPIDILTQGGDAILTETPNYILTEGT